MDDIGWWLTTIIPLVAMIGGFAYIIILSSQKARIRELEIRERIAMIEKGLVPPPEVDPRGFDRAMARYDRVQWSRGSGRHRRAGITLIGVGVGMMVLIGFSGSPEEGFAIGGFLAALGLAFLVNSFFEREHVQPPPANGSVPDSSGSIGPAAR